MRFFILEFLTAVFINFDYDTNYTWIKDDLVNNKKLDVMRLAFLSIFDV